LKIQTIVWQNHVHNQPKLIGRNTNKMWELCYKCLLQIGLQKGSLASYSYHLCRPKSKCNLQLSLWASPSPPPHSLFCYFKTKEKRKEGKRGVSAEVSVNEFLNLNLPYWFGKFSRLYSSTNFRNNFALQKETIYT
jgi:hypothetical protein